MAANTATLGVSHPSPHRGRVDLATLFFGMGAGPAGWALQLLCNYGLSSYSCYPRLVPRTSVLPGWGGIWYGLLAINIVALLLAIAGAVVSYRLWGMTRHERAEHSGALLETGEGRTRFLALVGILTSLGFVAAILFDTVMLVGVPQCIG